MTTRKSAPRVTPVLSAPARTWPPTCTAPTPDGGVCGWEGEPSEVASPYIACVLGGVHDRGRHRRAKVGAR